MPLKKLGVGHIKDVMDQGYVIVSQGKHKGEKKYASVNTKCRIKSVFNLMLDYALEHNLVVKNVARCFDVNDMRTEIDYNKKIKKAFTQEDVNILWGSLEDYDFPDVILIGIYTGFRPSELCELKLSNIDLDGNMIVGGMKTQAGTDRKVPIIPLIKPLVEKRYNQAVRLGSDWLLNDRRSTTGLHITYDKFRHRFEATLAELGLGDYTGHCCRVTFVTKCYSAKIPEYVIKRVVGHSLKDNITDDTYNRVSFDDIYNYMLQIEK
jgi:integrase